MKSTLHRQQKGEAMPKFLTWCDQPMIKEQYSSFHILVVSSMYNLLLFYLQIQVCTSSHSGFCGHMGVHSGFESVIQHRQRKLFNCVPVRLSYQRQKTIILCPPAPNNNYKQKKTSKLIEAIIKDLLMLFLCRASQQE